MSSTFFHLQNIDIYMVLKYLSTGSKPHLLVFLWILYFKGLASLNEYAVKAQVWPSYLCVVFVFICPSVLLKSRNMWPLHVWVINLPLRIMKPHLCSQFTLIWFMSHSHLLKCWCVPKTCSISEESDLLLTAIVLIVFKM